MGVVPKKETERDNELIADYLKKTITGEGEDDWEWEYSISQLGFKYARVVDGRVFPLTPTRVHQILDKYGVAKNRVKRG